MSINSSFDQLKHDQIVIDCFFKLWRHSVDLMFIMKVEEDGEFTLFDNNPKSKAAMGLPEDTSIDRMNIRDIWTDDIVEKLYGSYREAIEAREPVSVTQYATLNGKDIYVDTLLVPMFDASVAPTFVCGVSRDISRIKEAEQMAINASEKLKEYSTALEEMNHNLDVKVRERTAELEEAKHSVEEALAAKSSFVARMSHEIRTPINAVIGLSDLSLKATVDEYQKDNLQKILDSGKLLLSLVDDVLDFSKIEAGKLTIEKVPFSLQKIVQHAVDMSTLKASEKSILITTRISDLLPETLIGDPLRIQQILVNLVSNAVKFTEEGGVDIRFSCEEKGGHDLLLRCEVEDSGIGISPDQITGLFQSFQQADDSITRKFGGTGLGLTISRQLCELMEGEIWVESALGKGSTFIFTLPISSRSVLLDRQADSPPLSGDIVKGEVPYFSDYRILLVDDNPINLKVALGYLQEVDVKVDVALNGEEAVSQVILNDYNLILMDIQMPVMDGYTATGIIRHELNDKELPIVAMTAHVYHDAKEKAKEAGMDDYLGKPIIQSDLYAILETYLSSSRFKKINKLNIQAVDKPIDVHAVLCQLTKIDGLDVERAIRNVSGKETLYLDIVITFLKNYQNDKVNQNKFYLKRNCENIVNTVHTLKSNAAYVGAFPLSIACAKLESEWAQGEKDTLTLSSISASLETLISQLASVFDSVMREEEAESSAELTNDMLHDALEEILPLLEKSDFSVEEPLEKLSKATRENEFADAILAILNDVEEIEYENAADRVRQLLQRL